MKNRYQPTPPENRGPRKRIKSLDLAISHIRAELYVRLYSLLGIEPEILDEGYAFYLTDTQTGLMFSAEMTGFGPGYFSADNSAQAKSTIDAFHEELFHALTDLKECQVEYSNDFGKTVLGYHDGKFFETDLEDEDDDYDFDDEAGDDN